MKKRIFFPILLFFSVLTMFAFSLKTIIEKTNFSFKDKFTEKPKVYLLKKPMLCYVPKSTAVLVPELWSNPTTWGGTVPIAGQNVTIPANKHVILDVNTPDLAGLTINGVLEFDRANLNLTADYIVVMGEMHIGTPTNPFLQKATITLNATNSNENIMQMGTRGIMVMGGKLELHGLPPTKHYTKLNNHAAAGTSNLQLLESVNWNSNDEIVVATSDFYNAGNGNAQRTNISSVIGSTLNIQDGLNAQRWGKLQYLTATGMSLTPGTLPANLAATTPTVLDERAEVANLSRNIVIQSVDDSLWQNDGFGCHVMIMQSNGMNGEAHLNGVEIKRGGQSGKIGRYPFHWHMLSYNGTQTLPDATGQYIKNSTINQSAQRGIVIHGTNGVEVSKNVVYDVRGHGIFTEDASERRNIIDGNIVMKVRNPIDDKRLKNHETWRSQGSSGFWISNPDNIMTNNVAADCEGTGFWLAFPENTFGLSAGITLKPRVMQFGAFANNIAHSNKGAGIFIDHAEIDNEGNTGPSPQYASTTNMSEPNLSDLSNVLMYELGDYSTWKNNQTGIWNRSILVANRRSVNADNTSSFFSGSTWVGSVIEKSLVVGSSLNYNMNGVTIPTAYGSEPAAGFSTYNSSIDIKNNVNVNFSAVQGAVSGAFATGYYINPVEKGQIRNSGNITINSHPGVRVNPDEPQFSYGIIWDPYNHWGGPASSSTFSNNYYVFDNPYFTHDRTKYEIPNSTAQISNGVVVEGPFYGFKNFRVNGEDRDAEKISATRTTANGTYVGNWTVEAPVTPGLKLFNMRHFATHPTGFYYLDFPNINEVNDFTMVVNAMTSTDDYQVLSVEYSGNYDITQLFVSTSHNVNDFGITVPFTTIYGNTRAYTTVSNFQAVVNAPTGEVFWHDKPNNKVWFKVRGGFFAGDPLQSSYDNVNIYKPFSLRAYGTLAPLSNDEFNLNATNLKVYPNPTNDILNINWTNKNENDEVLVINSLGQTIYKNQDKKLAGENNLKIETSTWQSGVYFVKIGSSISKVIKQ